MLSVAAASGGSVELRTRNAKFLAELAKFGLLSASHYFDAVRACADELVSAPHTIDTVCALLETGAGRFFYAQPETHLPLVALLERMTAIKKARVHDAAQVCAREGVGIILQKSFWALFCIDIIVTCLTNIFLHLCGLSCSCSLVCLD